MQIIEINEFISYIQTEIPNCPDAFIGDKVLYAVIDFCSESWAWNIWTDKQTLESDESEINLDTPTQSVPVGVMAATKDGSDYPLDNIKLEDDVVTIKQDFSKDVNFQFHVALKPSRLATVVPRWILEDYAETIAFGAKWKIFSMAGQPWTNLELANWEYQNFRAGISKAFINKRMKEKTQRSMRVKPKQFI